MEVQGARVFTEKFIDRLKKPGTNTFDVLCEASELGCVGNVDVCSGSCVHPRQRRHDCPRHRYYCIGVASSPCSYIGVISSASLDEEHLGLSLKCRETFIVEQGDDLVLQVKRQKIRAKDHVLCAV